MRVASISFISCLLSLGSTLSIQPRALTKGENLVLLDCGIGNAPNGGSTSRQVAYYSGDIYKDAASGSYTTNPPTYLTPIPWDGSYPWRQSGVTAKTSNGDEWKITITPGIRDPNWAGYATHTYDSTALICWSLHGFGIYTLSDGTACTTAYVCNHQNGPPTTPKAPGPAPAPKPNFSHNFMGNEVTLVGDWSIDDLFKTAQLHDGGNGAQYCAGLDQKQTLVGTGKPGNPDCTIAFDCGPYNGDVMLSVAKQVLNSRKEAYSVTTQDLPRCDRDVTCLNPQACFETCHQGPDCYCKGDTSRKITTVGSGKTEIDMLGGSNPGQSRLTYKIDCPTAQQEHDCAVCMGLGKIKLVLDLFTFGIAGATTDFVCGLDGC